ncbi:RxLR effector protein [Phytophthora megakarya]|uniref:RxLR effector protein n=1 Tax=Phytophthora megakarya TaxID=4795 RepID=A0A225VHJ8_9STRA|nr:RxLR effector protein [Phytophthora megakarya]
MRLYGSFLALVVVTAYSSCSAYSTMEITKPSRSLLKTPRSLRGVETNANRKAEGVGNEERGGFDKFLNKIRYQSQ